MGIIYCYTNNITKYKYIGQTINPEDRFKQHKSSAFNPNARDYNTTFHKKVREYGWENFTYEILEETSDELLDEAEIKWIAYYDTYRNGYNDTPGGRGNSGPMKDETKKKLSLIKGQLSEEEIIAIRKAYANKESPSEYYNKYYKDIMHYNSFLNIWTGKKYGTIMPEVIEIGRHSKLDLELANQIRKEYQEDGISYQALADKYDVGKCTIRDVIKNRTWKNEESSIEIHTNKDRVMCIETGEIFDSVTEAAASIGRTQSALSKHLCGETYSCGKSDKGEKLHWKKV